MIAITLFAIVACASAAPHYRHNHHPQHHDYFPQHHDHFPQHHDQFHNNDHSLGQFMSGPVFDTRAFWEQMRKEMMGLTTMIDDLRKRFPTGLLDEQIEGNKYKITIALTGFEDKEITVKARQGLLIIEAVHKVAGEPERNYLDLRTLPDVVDVNGSWTYENGLLKIVFPLQQKSNGEPAVTEILPTQVPATQAPVTQAPEHSHEVVETEKNGSNIQDADVGIAGEVTNGGNSVSANEIPQGQNVEATTYAVDLKNEVELVPINY